MTQHHEEIFRDMLLKASSLYYGQALDCEDFEDRYFNKQLSQLYASLYVAFMYEDTAERMLKEMND